MTSDLTNTIKNRSYARELIESHMREFLEKGGKVTEIESKSLTVDDIKAEVIETLKEQKDLHRIYMGIVKTDKKPSRGTI